MAAHCACVSLPANLKAIQQYFDLAKDYEDSAVGYWCELYALRKGFLIQKAKEDLTFLLDLMDRLVKKKEELKSLETVSDLNAAQEHMKNLALQKFNEANAKLQLAIIDFNSFVFDTVFYAAESLLEVCSVFGPLSEELAKKKKYANCCTVVGGILNGFAPSDFQLAAIQAQKIDTEEELATVVKLIYVKAIAEPISSPAYAGMCLALSTKEVPSASNPADNKPFRMFLLRECQKKFEEDSTGRKDTKDEKEEIESADKETEKKDFEIKLKKNPLHRRRSLIGNIRFIGELLKIRIISVKILHQCILRLLSQPDDEDYLECLCILLTTTGKEIEYGFLASAGNSAKKIPNTSSTQPIHRKMDSYIATLESIVKNQTVSERILSMIQDVIDLRKRGWSITALGF